MRPFKCAVGKGPASQKRNMTNQNDLVSIMPRFDETALATTEIVGWVCCCRPYFAH